MRLWAKHDQGHASTYISIEDARVVIQAYDLLKALSKMGLLKPIIVDAILRGMEGPQAQEIRQLELPL